MERANNDERGPQGFETVQGSTKPPNTGPIGAPQFSSRGTGNGNEQQTPENNVSQVNIGGRSFNLNQLSQLSPQQLQIIASFIQMLQAGTTHPNNTLTPNARVAKFVGGMQTFIQEGRLMERQIEDPEYEEAILETEELNNSEDESQSRPHQEYNTNGASYYSAGRHLLIKPRLSPFILEILNHPMTRIKMPSCKYDASSDSDDHIATYEGHMFLYTQVEAIWCKVFPSTLPYYMVKMI